MTTATDHTAMFQRRADLLRKGHYLVVSSEFLDWCANSRPQLAERLCTIPNPDRVGVLDEFVAFTTLHRMHVAVDGILTWNGQPQTAHLSICKLVGDQSYSAWFVGFNNAQCYRSGMEKHDILELISSRKWRIVFHDHTPVESTVTRSRYCEELRSALKEEYEWARQSPEKLDSFIAGVQRMLEGGTGVIINKAFTAAWKACGLPGKVTYRGLHLLAPQ
jgi:hypothetical protein